MPMERHEMASFGSHDDLSRRSMSYASHRSKSISGVEIQTIRSEFGHFDPNIDPDAEQLEDDSPYPEVRSAVANFDDPSMPASTIRTWVLGILWAIILPGINQFYYFRYPSITVPALVAQLLSFPLGRLWANYVPQWKIFGHSLNPGEFTIKEHVLITVMAGVGASWAYASDIVAVQRITYDTKTSFAYGWLLVMSTQLIGFSVGGIAKRFLVAPASMIWPNTLVQCALFNTLHSANYPGIGRYNGMKRDRFFIIVFFAAAIWYIMPGFLFQALSYFTWVCWIAPNNIKINQLFGYRSGLGFSLLTFDWNQIAYIGSPLSTPWWAEANVIAGFLLFYWFITPILYYTNIFDAQYMPMSSRDLYDRHAEKYNVSKIMDGGELDHDKYTDYGPPFLSITFALSYGISFAGVTSTLVHAIIYFRRPIMTQLRRSLREQPDVHARLMSVYAQVPEWWYACLFVITFAFACICIQVYHTQMTIWALVIALFISLIYVIPIGMIKATTNREVGLNVITELIVGYMLPGKPVAMMMFKTWGYIGMSQAMIYVADFKLGHYMKIPPRPMFWAQIVATAIAGTVQLGVQSWMFTNIEDVCTEDQRQKFVCAGTNVFSSASVLDFKELLDPDYFSLAEATTMVNTMIRSYLDRDTKNFRGLTFFFLIGAVSPIIIWFITKRRPNSILNYTNVPLMLTGLGNIPPASAVNYVPWAITGAIFQYFIRRAHYSWWAKYNYVLSAALDCGTAISTVLIFFCLQYPLNGKIAGAVEGWWGNTVHMNTSDWHNVTLRTLADKNTIG